MLRDTEYSKRETKSMIDDSQATDATFDAEPTVPETSTAIVETPAQAPEKEKARRGAKSPKAAKPAKATRARKAAKAEEAVASASEVAAETVAKSAKAAKAAKPVKATRARKVAKVEEVVAPAPQVAAEPVVKTARKGKLASTVKAAKPAKPKKEVAPVKVAKSVGTAKRAKAEKTAKPTKVAKSATKVAIATPATAAKKAAPVATGGRDKGARYTTNELNSAVRKAGLTVEFTPVVTKPANIGRGPAKEFKVDMMVAHLRGSNGDLIRDRGPGTPMYNDAESLAAVEIFEKFRSRTFHNKLAVEIL